MLVRVVLHSLGRFFSHPPRYSPSRRCVSDNHPDEASTLSGVLDPVPRPPVKAPSDHLVALVVLRSLWRWRCLRWLDCGLGWRLGVASYVVCFCPRPEHLVLLRSREPRPPARAVPRLSALPLASSCCSSSLSAARAVCAAAASPFLRRRSARPTRAAYLVARRGSRPARHPAVGCRVTPAARGAARPPPHPLVPLLQWA